MTEPIAVSPADAADMLGVSKRTVYNLIGQGKLRARKLGARTLVDVATLQSYYKSLPENLIPLCGASVVRK